MDERGGKEGRRATNQGRWTTKEGRRRGEGRRREGGMANGLASDSRKQTRERVKRKRDGSYHLGKSRRCWQSHVYIRGVVLLLLHDTAFLLRHGAATSKATVEQKNGTKKKNNRNTWRRERKERGPGGLPHARQGQAEKGRDRAKGTASEPIGKR
jgi:hypothetical protein